ncbi:hypothetical protein DSOUD_0443 [Desulfuromonas soudanensis]|uniref:Lipoprotein n=1 Tax=Desulfuromonas soudanensis TaxID=1603606 RepID=A0A0M4DF06_9BACT|nr:hypothetical protein [Desulfuromonas soudanensis]ALC15237.1 hypothetical protein DSOUD_0443 [Desulfuromonas soudanensis]
MSRICSFAALFFLCACSGGDTTAYDLGPGGSDPDLSDISVYVSDGSYAEVLKACSTADMAGLCTLGTLPLIGDESPTPTIPDVMSRVLVSHPWMAVRFEEVLNNLPPDMLTLFKGVTAIVIDSDIRPSFYSAGTAAIYLDPASLWLTNEEKATISRAADYRSNFGADLQFIDLWRYVKGNDYAYASYSLTGTETRQLSDLTFPLARLLYHELAHANDLLPPGSQPALDLQMTPYQAILSLADVTIAERLHAASPLTSELWLSLAQVLYRGVPATPEQIDYSADVVGDSFASDVANETYSYSSKYEDVAMLFEEAMMKYHFDIDRDIAFTDLPLTITPTCDDYRVRWGVRNRLGDPVVKPRAEFVAAALLPGVDLGTFFADFPTPTSMAIDQGWCSNLTLLAVAHQGLAPKKEIHPDQFRQDLLLPGD